MTDPVGEKYEELVTLNADTFRMKRNDYGRASEKTGDVFGVLDEGRPIKLSSSFEKNYYGMETRLMDKVCRQHELFHHADREVSDESLKDSLMDLSNYALIMAAQVAVENE